MRCTELMPDARRPGHRCAGPVRGLAWRRGERQADDALGDRGVELGDARWPRLVAQKALETFRGEALLPAPDAGLGLGRLAHDRARAQALDRQEHDLRPPDVLLRRVSLFNESVKPIEIGGRDGKRNAGSHPPNFARRDPARNPSGINCQI